MKKKTVEIKARCDDHEVVRAMLRERQADFRGSDHQIDTYYDVPVGRLKLRRGNIENALIYYDRPDQPEPKESDVLLHETGETGSLADILDKLFGRLVVVDKRREIYFIGNVKFHLDLVEGLGTFVEIEAIDDEGRYPVEELRRQCTDYVTLFGIRERDLLMSSYSDMLMCAAGLAQGVRP